LRLHDYFIAKVDRPAEAGRSRRLRHQQRHDGQGRRPRARAYRASRPT
jgi:hypothetical protein